MTQDIVLSKIKPENTAIRRKKLSAPLAYLLRNSYLDDTNKTILDFGCGYGYDVVQLKFTGYKVTGYDPYYYPEQPSGHFDIALCFYVLNVIPLAEERNRVIKRVMSLADQAFFVVRAEISGSTFVPLLDGYYSRTKCAFNRMYLMEEFLDLFKDYRVGMKHHERHFNLVQVYNE